MDKRAWKRDTDREECAHCPAWKLHVERGKHLAAVVPKALILVRFCTSVLFKYTVCTVLWLRLELCGR